MNATKAQNGRTALLLSTVAVAALMASVAQARQAATPAESTQVDEVVVTGSFTNSLKDALQLKRNADGVSDAVSASDIGNFPAVNVAEALQRVPGVSISREAGEGQFVSVRGLGPNFQAVTLNGSPIAYNENIRNSDQSGRQFQFRVIPADLISAIVVAKTPTPDMIDGGIGSNIDIRLAKALDTDPFVSARAFTHYENRTEEHTPNGSLSGAWRNADNTFGVVAGVSYQTRDVQFERFQSFGYTKRVIDGQSVNVANDLTLTLEHEERRRLSAMAGLQWKPVDNLSITLDTLYSNFKNKIDENRIGFEWGGRADFAARLVPGSAVVKNGVLYGGTINGGRVSRNAEFSAQNHKNTFVKLAADYAVAGWTFTPSISYSEALSGLDTPLQRLESRTADNAAGLTYSFAYGDDPVGDLSVAKVNTNLNLLSPTSTAFSSYRIRPTNSKDKDTTGLFDLSRRLDFGNDAFRLGELRVGGQYTDRSRDYQRRDRVLAARAGVVVDGSFLDYRLNSNVFDKTIDNGIGPWMSFNRGKFMNAFVVPNGEYDGAAPQSDDLIATGADMQQSYFVGEKVKALYGRADFESQLGGKSVSGNFGVRWVSTETTVRGTLLTATTGAGGAVTTVITPKTFEGSYDKFLPSLNVKVDLTDGLLLRLAASRSLTRPSLADLRTATVPNSSLISDVYERGQLALDQAAASSKVGVGGNPELMPYTSTNFDASLEWYFSKFGGVSVAAFHKDISDFIGAIARPETVVFSTRAGQTLTSELLITRPQNIGDAKISGVEFGASYKLDFGLGIAASATFTNSEGEIQTAAGKTKAKLQGVSDTSYSISPFYEKGPFEVHFSYTFRSEFAANGNISPGSNAVTDPNAAILADDFGTWDVGASWKINRQFQVFLEGTNITDERQGVYQGNKNQLFQIHEYGPSYNFGLRATF